MNQNLCPDEFDEKLGELIGGILGGLVGGGAGTVGMENHVALHLWRNCTQG
jgi:hypothetical protein